MNKEIDELYDQIQVLNATLWENKALRPRVDEWLNNFKNTDERMYALYLLTRFMYFNSNNIRNLLKTIYRDLFRYPIIEEIRKKNHNTLEESIIEKAFKEELQATRFLGVGNPSESGVHLLYYFRQENKISKDLFVNTDDIIEYSSSGTPLLREKYKNVKRFVFIDDICGSGTQATSDDSNVKRCVGNIRNVAEESKIYYLMMFGLSRGISVVRSSGLYDNVEAVLELDDSYRCFSEGSRYFPIGSSDKATAKEIAYKYGYQLIKHIAIASGYNSPDDQIFAQKHALGFGDCQLLIGMHHNTPDNTLPIFWFDEDETQWMPIFKRYNKVYSL